MRHLGELGEAKEQCPKASVELMVTKTGTVGFTPICTLMTISVDALGNIGLHCAIEHEFGEVLQEIFAAQSRESVLMAVLASNV